MPPRVTLVTTFRNAGPYLAEALDSVCAQRFEDWELILVDDGSDDESVSIARAFAQREPRCTLVQQPPRGRQAALSVAHARARGRYVAWLDADDRLRPESLEVCVDQLDAAPWAGMVFTDRQVIGTDGEPIPSQARMRPSSLGLLRAFSTFHFRLFRTEVLERAGGVGPYPIAIDYDLCLRVWEEAPVLWLDEVLYEYRRHDGQLSRRTQLEQADASAAAIRDALARRGLSSALELRLEGTPPRFWVHSPLHRRGRMPSRVRRALRRHRSARSPETAWVWPDRGGDLELLATEGLFTRGVMPAFIRPTLDGLMTALRSSATPDLLVLGDWATEIGGDRMNEARLCGALSRMRALGCRIVWCDWEARRPALPRSWVSRMCSSTLDADAVLPPHPLGLVPVRDRGLARTRLGLHRDALVVATVGRVPGDGLAWIPSAGEILACRGDPARDRDLVAGADLIVFGEHDGAIPPLWLEALAAGRLVSPTRALNRSLVRRVSGWVDPRNRSQHDVPDVMSVRRQWRAAGLVLREQLRHYDPARFATEHLIGESEDRDRSSSIVR